MIIPGRIICTFTIAGVNGAACTFISNAGALAIQLYRSFKKWGPHSSPSSPLSAAASSLRPSSVTSEWHSE